MLGTALIRGTSFASVHCTTDAPTPALQARAANVGALSCAPTSDEDIAAPLGVCSNALLGLRSQSVTQSLQEAFGLSARVLDDTRQVVEPHRHRAQLGRLVGEAWVEVGV